ncbi:hypothetical protein [Cryobacterium sp. GrIS_2_6]|uniref:hypothetical protein n=1 Tax=Cryobacterium sp. GrIS_2_6 TaxID=3162785 RepID=UPI002E06BF4E|nr:hypothetical protein [Cryobacterium psychrotolerans]
MVHPLVHVLPLVGSGGWVVVAEQVAFTVANIVAKIWFGGVLHRIAKLRTAGDVRAGSDVHPEAIRISSVKQSDAGKPREVYLGCGRAPAASAAADEYGRTDLEPWSPSGTPRPAESHLSGQESPAERSLSTGKVMAT